MNNEKFKELMADFGDYRLIDNLSCEKLIDIINKDYQELIELRNKIAYEIENDNIYEEDKHTLDHALDNIELLLKILNLQKEEMKN